MLKGLPASFILHGLVIGVGYVAWPYMAKTEIIEAEVVPIEITMVADITDVRAIPRADTNPLPDVQPEAEETPQDLLEQMPDELEGDDPPEQDRDAPPEESEDPIEIPDETAQPEKKEPEKKEPPKKPETKKPEPKKPEPKDDLDLDSFAEEFDKARESGGRQPPNRSQTPPASSDEKPRRGAGEQERAVASVQSMLVSQMKQCWETVVGLPNPERLVVTVNVKLGKDGTIIGAPKLKKPSRIPIGDKPMQIAIERALLATEKCEPYRLPADYYDIWGDIDFVVGPDS